MGAATGEFTDDESSWWVRSSSYREWLADPRSFLDAVEAELARQDITEVIVGLVAGNDGAQRLYERRAFRPRWLILARSGT